MSLVKSKQLKEFSRIPEEKQYDALQFKTSRHREAFYFLISVHNGLKLKRDRETLPEADKRWADYHYKEAIKAFEDRLFDAYKRKDGNFFHALGDVIQEENRNSDWSERERYIYVHCSMAKELGETLPSAGQILRGWKISCGIVPDNSDDLEILWSACFGDKPIPKNSRAEIERKLQLFLGQPFPDRANVQIVQIQREAKNLGFDLPKKRKRGLPAGIQRGR